LGNIARLQYFIVYLAKACMAIFCVQILSNTYFAVWTLEACTPQVLQHGQIYFACEKFAFRVLFARVPNFNLWFGVSEGTARLPNPAPTAASKSARYICKN
jgi:hypothetical protein